MTGHVPGQRARKLLRDQVSVTPGYVGKRAVVPRGAHIRDGSLQQVAGAVELVAHRRVRETPAMLDDLDVGVQVTIGLLRLPEQLHGVREEPLARLVPAAGALPRDRLKHLVDVRVAEEGHRVVRGGAGRDACGQPEVVEAASLLEHAYPVRDRRVAVQDLIVTPEPAIDPHPAGAGRTECQAFESGRRHWPGAGVSGAGRCLRHRSLSSSITMWRARSASHDCGRNKPACLGRLDSRRTRLTGSFCKPEAGRPSMAASSRSPATWPSSLRFMSTVVSGGRQAAAKISQLSKPTSATSSGTCLPASRMASATPRAIWSLP